MTTRSNPACLLILIAILTGITGCKENTTDATSGGTNYGSGTISAHYTNASQPTAALLTFSGNGFWPPIGTGVAASLHSEGKKMECVGYRQLSAAKLMDDAGPSYNVLYINIDDASGISSKTYTDDFEIWVGINITVTAAVE